MMVWKLGRRLCDDDQPDELDGLDEPNKPDKPDRSDNDWKKSRPDNHIKGTSQGVA
jgi:hypothetical protein